MTESINRYIAASADEIDLRDVLRFLWKSRWPIIFPALICLLGAMIFQGLQVLALGGPTTHSVVVRFTFPGADVGRYPNGQPFALSDVISGVVLQEVGKRLSQQGEEVDVAALATRVGIHPHAPAEPFIVRRFTDQLDNEALTGPEIQALEAEFEEELQRAMHQSARISLTVERNSAWSPELAAKILHEIPRAWAEIAVNQRGVLDVPVPGSGAMVLDEPAQAEFLVLLARIKNFTRRIMAGLRGLDASERARLVTDPATGFSARDFIASGADILQFRLLPLEQAVIQQGVFRDVSRVVAYFAAKLHEETEVRAELLRKGEIISSVLQQYETGNTKLTQTMAGAREGVAEPVTVEYMDKMLAIGNTLAESEFRQELASRHLKLMVEAEESTTRIRHLTRVLDAAKQHLGNPPNDSTSIQPGIEELVVEFTALREGYDRLRNAVRTTMLGGSHLYRMQSDSPHIVDPVQAGTDRLLLMALIALITGGMLGVVVQFARAAVLLPARSIEEITR